MRKHLQYARYLLRHKWYVFVAGLDTRAPFWRLAVHDWSKFLPSEWRPYAQFFYGKRETAEARRMSLQIVGAAFGKTEVESQADFDRAWLLHQHRNPHHWQFWLLKEDSGAIRPLPMPEKFVREMVADWAGAGKAITGRWGVADWYEANREKIVLADSTRRRVEELIDAHFAR